MFYIMKDIRITDDAKVYLTCADSNLSPLLFYEAEYAADEKDIRKKLSLLFKSILEGNIHPEGSKVSYIKNAVRKVQKYKRKYAPDTNFDDDFRYGTRRERELNMLISEKIGSLAILNPDRCNVPYEGLKSSLQDFDAETKKIYGKIEKKFEMEEICVVSSASMSQVFPGYDILYRPENNECVVCKRENYDNHGHLDNKDHSAIFLGAGSGDAYYCLCDTVGAEPNGPEIDWTALSDLYMDKLPYKGFNPDDYGMSVTPELRQELKTKAIKEGMRRKSAERKGLAR